MCELEKVKFENPTIRAFWVSPTDTEFWQIWPMWYQFRHVLMVQITCALELKPHLHNDYDPWKKITNLCIGNRPTATTLVKICPKNLSLSKGT